MKAGEDKRWFLRKLLDLFSGQTVVFLFFLLLSFSFWLMQRWDDEVEMEVVVPLRLTQVPADVVVLGESATDITVRVKDKGTAVLHYWWTRPDTISLSFRDYYAGLSSGFFCIKANELKQKIQATMPPTMRMVSMAPDTLAVYYNHGEHKRLPVRLMGSQTVAGNHTKESVVLEPDFVEVYSTVEVFDTLTCVQTVPLDTSNLTRTLIRTLPLKPIRGSRFSEDAVRVTIKVDALGDDRREVPIVSANFPAGKALRLFPSTVTVRYSVGNNQRQNIKAKDFVFFVTYEDILDLQRKGNTRLPLHLKRQPEGVTNVRFSPREVDYLIETSDEAL